MNGGRESERSPSSSVPCGTSSYRQRNASYRALPKIQLLFTYDPVFDSALGHHSPLETDSKEELSMGNSNQMGVIFLGLCVAAGMSIGGFFIGQTMLNAKVALNTAEVKGLAERRVESDRAKRCLMRDG